MVVGQGGSGEATEHRRVRRRHLQQGQQGKGSITPSLHSVLSLISQRNDEYFTITEEDHQRTSWRRT